MGTHEDFFNNRQRYYRGTAKVRPNFLAFEDGTVQDGRFLDQRNVQRLVQIYESEGYRPLETENRITAIVAQDQLDIAMDISHVSQADLLQNLAVPPELHFDSDKALLCLSGKHRVAAAVAAESVRPADRWCVVEMYTDDMPKAAVLDLRAEHPNASNYPSGEAFRHFRGHKLLGENALANRWLSRLSQRLKGYVVTLSRKWDGRLLAAFDGNLPLVGLWRGLDVGSFERILPLGCYEELEHYLSHIQRSWSFILGNDSILKARLDPDTVAHLQGLAPQYSLGDRSRIIELMESRQLFPLITGDSERQSISHRLARFQGRIPSLYTFVEDTIYLEPCAKILKSLIPPLGKRSIRELLMQNYIQRGDEAVIETEEGKFIVAAADRTRAIDVGYCQLWLFAMRHFPEMTGIAPRKENGEPKPKVQILEDLGPRLAASASKLGFETGLIEKLRQQDPTRAIIRGILQKHRPNDRFLTPSPTIELRMSQILDSIPARPSSPQNPVLSDETGQDLRFRYGKPSLRSHEADKRFMFFPHICARIHNVNTNISSFGVKRDIFLSFFGGLSVFSDEMHQESVNLEQPTVDTTQESIRSSAGQQSSPALMVSPSIYTTYDGASRNSICSRASAINPITDADLAELGLSIHYHDPVRKIPDDDNGIIRVLQSSLRDGMVFLYMFETGEYLLLPTNSPQFYTMMCVWTDGSVFFGIYESQHIYLGLEDAISFAKERNFLFVQSGSKRKEPLKQLSVKTRNEIVAVWDHFREQSQCSKLTGPELIYMPPFTIGYEWI